LAEKYDTATIRSRGESIGIIYLLYVWSD